MFTILAEFPSYCEQDISSFSCAKLEVVYKEALRQRASKYTMLSQLINLHRYRDDTQKNIRDYTSKLLHPHFISEHREDKKETKKGWDTLRLARK